MDQRFFSTFLPLLSALITLSGPASVFGSTFECVQLNIQAHLGQDAPHRDVSGLELYDPASHYSFLGKGEMGGVVYRVRPSNGKPPYVLKQYFDAEKRKRDELGFEKLRQLFPPKDGIEIVHSEVHGELSMILPNVEGETLEKVVSNPNLSDSERIQLTQRWNQFIKKADSVIKGDSHSSGRMYNTLSSLHRYYAHFAENGQKFIVFLKPDNVIIDPKTGRMFVVDPY